ncbi:MAG: pyridoxal phosphate-dependent aminotransferase [Tissierellia bacterium]|nr:pyridoxal phosphate-dependent aminotransferase [Tissierellia bacterium]
MKYNFDKYVDRKNTNASKIDNLKALFGRDDIIPLWVADMDFEVAEPIIKAGQNVLDRKVFGYSERPSEYYESYKKWQKKRNNFDIDTSLMSHEAGVVPAMQATVEALTEPGDGVVIQPPIYPPFFKTSESIDRVIYTNELVQNENGTYEIDFEDFEEKISREDVKLFVICNPHNPTGNAWSREDLEKMGNICLKHNVTVLSDEIHSDLMVFGNKHVPTASISDEIKANTITYLSPTKTFNLAGIQTSIILFNNMENKNKFDELAMKNSKGRTNCFAIDMCIAAFEEGEEWLEQLLLYIEGNMKFVVNYIEENIPELKVYLPEATYLLWIDFRNLGLSEDELRDLLINEAKIGLNDGVPYGKPGIGFQRLNVATSRAVLEEAMKRLEKAIRK